MLSSGTACWLLVVGPQQYRSVPQGAAVLNAGRPGSTKAACGKGARRCSRRNGRKSHMVVGTLASAGVVRLIPRRFRSLPAAAATRS